MLSMPKSRAPKRLFMMKPRKLSRHLTDPPILVPPKFIPTTSLVQPPLAKVIVTPSRLFPIIHHYDYFVVNDERIERISGLNLLGSTIHSDCVVTSSLILQGGSKIPSKTLADTGCTRDIYV